MHSDGDPGELSRVAGEGERIAEEREKLAARREQRIQHLAAREAGPDDRELLANARERVADEQRSEDL